MTETTISEPRTRVMWSTGERAEWPSLFEPSGQSAAEFCRHNDLSPATLSFWLRQQQSGTFDFPKDPAAVSRMSPAQLEVLLKGVQFTRANGGYRR